MRIIDLTHRVESRAEAFPGDSSPRMTFTARLPKDEFNLTDLSVCVHYGTHMDAPFHFLADGITIDEIPLDWLYGPATRIDIRKGAGELITVEDFRPYERHLTPGARIILNTGWHARFGQPAFYKDHPDIAHPAGEYLASRQLRLLGMDLPTPNHDYTPIHKALMGAGVVLVESLANLDALPERFTFCALPLKLAGRDGSPVRAVGMADE